MKLVRIHRKRRQDFICSVRVARRVLRGAPNYKLGTLVEHVGLRVPSNAHRALADAEMTAKLWIAMEQTLQRRFGLQNVPLTLFDRLQSVTIAKADQYLRNYARAQHRPVYKTTATRKPNISQKPASGTSVRSRKKTARESPSPDRFDSLESVKCITCGYAISVVNLDRIRWLKCPCCGFNTPQRHTG